MLEKLLITKDFCHFLFFSSFPAKQSSLSLSANFEAHTLQNDVVVFCRLGVKDENGQAIFSSLEAFGSKIQGKTVSNILVDHDFCKIAWLAWFNSGMRIKYDRTCQWSIKIISIEKTFALHKSAQKKTFFPWIFFKRKLLMSST